MLRNPSELFLAATLMIFTIPFLLWKYLRTDNYAPLFVVQIVCGIILGPAILGSIYPDFYNYIFTESNIDILSGVAWLGVIFFVWLAGIHLDLRVAIKNKKDSLVTSFFALSVPLVVGCVFAYIIHNSQWMGSDAMPWQFSLGIGMGIAVTALPILILLMEKLEIFHLNIGKRLLRYASLDDLLIWAVLSIIIMDWDRSIRQIVFIPVFILFSFILNKVVIKLKNKSDIWPISLIWVIFISLIADWAGLHYMVGAFLAGAVMKSEWFDQKDLDYIKKNILLLLMPVFFLITGLKTDWSISGGAAIVAMAITLFIIQFISKGAGIFISGKILRWKSSDWIFISTLLQTKGLIEIIFASILLEKQIITSEMFTALLIMAILSTISTVPIIRALNKKNITLVN